ncbi:MAG TPA: hypothetical protein VIF57_18490 [Polyangia bacterium]
MVIGLAVVTGAACRGARKEEGPPYSAARAVVDRHCVGCHSERPTVPAFPIAAGGLVLDTSELMQMHAARIKLRVVQKRDMPLLNKSEMTEDERALLGAWVDSGAVGPRS